MNRTYTVRCPDCGHLAIRSHLKRRVEPKSEGAIDETMATECPSCDYLLVTCSVSGKVLDAHSSTTSVIARKQPIDDHPSISPRVGSAISWSIRRSA
ncbi:hypothetical protein I4641_04715 [Waterburya agarophytonicola K14]|uniref:Uncharacterized protein n=1 Tax=Waterburya agarophytonicola KI4 TaxID=2874699 RepID=A0A964FET9_9CYAN|nr:hypothetical protein [Waterburya agarophytonicola]MCC0176277.1 hypothetical protein [Waterburya agarophytonicola KI4]